MDSRFQALTLGEIVAADYRTAAIFDSFGLDYCCGGKRSVEDSCRVKGVDATGVVAALDALGGSTGTTTPADEEWDAGELVDHIVRTHHGYVRRALPAISAHLEKLVRVHGERHPELGRVAEHFDQVGRELQMHMFKEEQVLFPYVKGLAAAKTGAPPPPNMFGTVQNPIRMMEAEHQSAGNELALIRELTSDYQVPADGCATFRVCYEELAAFDRDLRLHIHLENNVLFPMAVRLEGQFGARVRFGC